MKLLNNFHQVYDIDCFFEIKQINKLCLTRQELDLQFIHMNLSKLKEQIINRYVY